MVLTMKGIEFVEKWFSAEHIPASLTKIYQLLLKLIWMKGIMEAELAQKLGFSSLCIEKAVSAGYVKVSSLPIMPEKDAQQKISRLVGKPPRRLYA